MTSAAPLPDVAAFLAMLARLDGPTSRALGPEAARRQMREAMPLVDLPAGPLGEMRDLAIPGPAGSIPARLFDSRAERGPCPVLLFLHGGGWVLGDLDTHAPLCATIARALDVPVVSIDYRLAPEHPYPAAPDDCEAAARWLASSPPELGRAASALILAGDSAGGALAIVTAMALRDEPARVPLKALWAIYPAVDAAHLYPSFTRFADAYGMSRDSMDWFAQCYAADLDHWRGAPIKGVLAGLPPTIVLTAELDPLVDQGRAFAAACVQAGVETLYREARGTIHGFTSMRKVLPSAAIEVDRALEALTVMLADDAA